MIDPTLQTATRWYAATWWTAISGLGQLLAAIFAAWAALVAKRAAKAAENSVEVTKQMAIAADISSRHRDRAYVALADTKGPPHYIAGTPIDMTFIFKNVGVTPAYRVRFGAFLLIHHTAPTEAFLDDNLANLGTIGPMAPSIPIPIRCRKIDGQSLALNEQGIEALRKKECAVIASAKVIYDDAFGVEHITRVAYHFDPAVEGFRFAPYYNSMT